MQWLRNIYYGIRNLIRWAPIIWQDRDWDYCYALKIMELKFRNMATAMNRNGRHVGYERVVRELTICAELCSRLTNNNYDLGAYWFNDKQVEAYMTQDLQASLYDNKYENEWRTWRNHEASMCKQDLDYLCKMMSKYMFGWWD